MVHIKNFIIGFLQGLKFEIVVVQRHECWKWAAKDFSLYTNESYGNGYLLKKKQIWIIHLEFQNS